MSKKFWKWKVTDILNETTGETTQERELRIEGIIAENSWFDDDVSPKLFRNELNAGRGRLKLWINSPGGDVFAASQIYTMLKEYKDGVDVYIDGFTASAASVIAMSGEKVYMSPTSYLLIHDPETISIGNTAEMKEAIKMLNEIKEGIVSAYELKTKLPRDEISKMMSAETMMNAQKAVELGFADEMLYSENQTTNNAEGLIYSRQAVTNCFLEKVKRRYKVDNRVDSNQLHKRLNLLARTR